MPAKATFILDTSFITRLGAFNAFCEQRGIPKALLPIHGLDYLASRKATFILPNEVLREITHDIPGQAGMVWDSSGWPTIHTESLRYGAERYRSESSPFLDFFLRYADKHRVLCFKSIERYEHALESGKFKNPSGTIAVVTDKELPHEARMPFNKDMDGKICDSELINIIHHLMPEHDLTHAPIALMTGRGSLKAEFLNEGKYSQENEVRLNLSSYLNMLQMTGFFPPGASATIDKVIEEYRQVPSHEDAMGKPCLPHVKLKLLEFINRADLGATTTINEITGYHKLNKNQAEESQGYSAA